MARRKPALPAIILFLIVAMIISMITPLAPLAETQEKKVVRVGWHDSPYFITDENGRYSGYSYEYQRKVAAYTGWEYEYVHGTWTDLFEMLKNGEIDLLSDVSYTEERSKEMLFTSLPMGTEAYYIFIAPDEKEISGDNPSSLNGKRVGVAKDTIQNEFFKKWAQMHDVEVEIVEENGQAEDSLAKLGTAYDAFVTMDVYGTPDTAIPIIKVGSSDFYFAVNKDRPDLQAELDVALSKIQDENKYYDQQLHDKYLKSTETNRYLSGTEIDWLKQHGAIRVGYQDNYLAFCAKDEGTGELTGALKDYLDNASTSFENAHIDFVTVAYPTTSDAIDALEKGEIDCLFPANLTDYDAEQLNLVMTPALMRTEMDAVVRESEQKEFMRKEGITVAVNEGNTNYDMFLAEHFPDWNRAYYKDTPAGLDAIADGSADCVIISNYRYSNISKQCEKLHLTTLYTGVDMDYCFAVREGDTVLYSILAALTGVVPETIIHSALIYYSTEDVKVTFMDIIKENFGLIMTVVAVILFIILILLLHSIMAIKKVQETENQVKDLNERVFVDSLTSVRNKGAYSDYMRELQNHVNNGEGHGFAVGMFDCNDLKKINDRYGHDKGDIYLKNACQLICEIYDHSPVFRIGGDEFVVILENDTLDKLDELFNAFKKRQSEINEEVTNEWEEIHVANGYAVYDSKLDRSVDDTLRRADKNMYENKRKEKEKSKQHSKQHSRRS